MCTSDSPTPIKRSWLLSNEDFREFANTDKFGEWGLFVLWENGITCPDDAEMKIEMARFQEFYDCPFCGNTEGAYKLNTQQYKCKKCLRKYSFTSGTYIENTKLECHFWWRFAFLIGDMKITNSQTIAHDLGVSQKTSWGMIEVLRKARKEISKKQFTNGASVLSFNHSNEVLDILLSLVKNNDKPVDKGDLLKQIYKLVITQNKIPFKEVVYCEPITNSVYSRINLQFKCKGIFIDIHKKTRIRQFKGYGEIGEEFFSLSSPSNYKSSHIEDMRNTLVKIISDKSYVPHSEEITQVIVKPDVFQMLTEPEHTPQTIKEDSIPEPTVLPEPVVESPPVEIINPAIEKRCGRKECNKIKPLSEFSSGKNLDGKQSYCKECSKLLSSQYADKLKKEGELRKLAYPPPIISAPTISDSEKKKITEKQCRRKECQKVKPLSEFNRGHNKDGYQSYCKECTYLVSKIASDKRKENALKLLPEINPLIEKRCARRSCLKIKPLAEFSIVKGTDQYESWCTECIADKISKSIKPAEKPVIKETSKAEVISEFKRNKVIDFLDLRNR